MRNKNKKMYFGTLCLAFVAMFALTLQANAAGSRYWEQYFTEDEKDVIDRFADKRVRKLIKEKDDKWKNILKDYHVDKNDVLGSEDGTAGFVLTTDGNHAEWEMIQIVNDTSPELGGDLSVNGFDIVSSGNGDIVFDPGGTGDVVFEGDLFTDRWLDQDSNTLIGIDVAGADSLTHSTGDEGYYNTALGYRAMYDITDAEYNVAVGSSALENITTGSYNVAIGSEALFTNTTGGLNVAVGRQALYNSTANYNTAIGHEALKEDTTGYDNTAIGYEAGEDLTTGYRNTFIGKIAGQNVSTGDYNIVIGAHQDVATPTGDYQLNIGGTIYGDLFTDMVGIGEDTPLAALDVDGDSIRIQDNQSPGDSSSCSAGEIAWDSNYIYVCVSTDTWKRTALSSYGS